MKKNILKITVCFVAALMFSLLFCFAVYATNLQKSFDCDLYGNVIRLHIIANSDSSYDQKAKLEVRDMVLQYIDSLTKDAVTSKQAQDVINRNLSNINEFVLLACENLGYGYSVDTEFCTEYYPVRYYENLTFPAGKYKSLKITLGSGEGKNWWCVLYPSVCTSASTDHFCELKSAGVSDNTASVICSENRNIRFSLFILDIFDGKN